MYIHDNGHDNSHAPQPLQIKAEGGGHSVVVYIALVRIGLHHNVCLVYIDF